jgi:hypothetical protein
MVDVVRETRLACKFDRGFREALDEEVFKDQRVQIATISLHPRCLTTERRDEGSEVLSIVVVLNCFRRDSHLQKMSHPEKVTRG